MCEPTVVTVVLLPLSYSTIHYSTVQYITVHYITLHYSYNVMHQAELQGQAGGREAGQHTVLLWTPLHGRSESNILFYSREGWGGMLTFLDTFANTLITF